ncbi:MAG: carboxypeptidase regulatory-like domain-containing protein [Acidobacteriota bacterium]|nr:carboxypeptidase regulatory-like domain-containing protein [Acidobacteriota bacterium]
MLKRLSILLLTAALMMALGQKGKAPVERSVTGVVTDAGGQAVPGAQVLLKNMKTLQVRSFIAKEKGEYFFNGLSTDVDYELRAQAQGHSSSPHTLSTFDSRKEATINLQLK